MVEHNSGAHEEGVKEQREKLPPEMQNRLGEFELGLHNVRESTKARAIP